MRQTLFLLFYLSCFHFLSAQVTASFTTPDTVCVNTPVTITNTSANATSYYWNFCVADINMPPVGLNLGNIGGQLQKPVYIDYAFDNGNYYGFVTNNYPGSLVRLDFGNSLLNTPTATNLGTVGGVIPGNTEGIQIVKSGGLWCLIIVGGDPIGGGTPSKIVKIGLGTNIANNFPVGTDWGNIGSLAYPHDLYVFDDNGHWYGFTVNTANNTITKFDFTTSFSNTPTAINLGNIGNLSGPTGVQAIKDNNNWYIFVTNATSSTLTRLDFGNSLLNTPTGQNLGNISGAFHTSWDIYVMKFCGEFVGFVINADQSYNDLVRLNFGGSIVNTPVGTSLGNIGNCLFPHCISKIFRVGADLYSFITNVDNNTLTRLRFTGCTNASIPNSAAQNPAPVIYNTPGIYNINLSVDDGLPTQTSFCKQVVVQSCGRQISGIINDYTPVLALNPCDNKITVEDASAFNIGDTVLMIQMKGAVIDSSNTSSFGTVTDYRNSGNYEFNYAKSRSGNIIELKNKLTRQYDIPNGKVQLIRVPYYQSADITSTLTCLPWDGSKGGVLVLNVQDTITLNSNIDVGGKGFRGGNDPFSNPSSFYCYENQYYYPPNQDLASEKGEGIATVSSSKSFGKGALANGGGGGNSHNSGGGGGSNGASGGFGGYNFEGVPCNTIVPFDNRGIGGNNLLYNNPANKIFLGGGGGGGQSNNPEAFQSKGGNGSGIVIVIGDKLKTNSNKIIANGNDGNACGNTNSGCHEGMGGGGGGGAILMNVTTYLDNTAIEAKGGKGADMTASGFLKVGPGGGGGSGIVWLNNTSLPGNLNLSATGGVNGVCTGYANDPWGSTAGQASATILNLKMSFDTVLFKPNIDSVRIKDSVTGCRSFDFKGLAYTNTNPISTWQWYFGDGGTANTQNTNHTYSTGGSFTVKLVITDINGCKDSTSKNVTTSATPNFDFGYQLNICNPLSVQFSGVGNDTQNPYWSFGDGGIITGNLNPNHIYTSQGNYIIKYSVANGNCSDTISKTINLSIINDDIILTHDTTICSGATKQLLTVPSLSFCWSPTTYLNNPNVANPVTTTPQNITYYFTAQTQGTNLIINGDFAAGNSGFTSQYAYANPNVTEGQYFVGTNAQAWNSSMSACSDHTTGTGNMMMVNGSPTPNVRVWTETVTVIPNTNYAFSTWIQALWPPNPAQLQFSINGSDIGTPITASLPTCTWKQFYTTWNSGNSTSATISIVNKNTQVQGNDFALDDISFAPVLIKRDSVKITVENPLVKTNNDTAACAGVQVQLNTTGANAYIWTPVAGLNNPAIANPVATPANSTQYIVTGTTVNGCVAKDTVNINVLPRPVITRSNDTAICKNSSAQLFASGGINYSWSPVTGLNNSSIPNPVATPATNTTYFVTVTGANTCSNIDSVKLSIRPDPVFSVSSPASICQNDSLHLTASGGNIYNWQPSSNINNPNISNPVVFPLNTTIYTVQITEAICNISSILSTTVTVNPLPVVLAGKSNDIDCTTDFSLLSASGASQYFWTPGNTLNNPAIANPVARPVVQTQYIVRGKDINGCINYDSVTVDITGLNKGGYLMPSAFTPNNDGMNDCYGIKYWGVIEKLDFAIFNRWGQEIFHTKKVGDCWNGMYKGVKQNPDVYVYLITAQTSCGKVFRKGTFALIR